MEYIRSVFLQTLVYNNFVIENLFNFFISKFRILIQIFVITLALSLSENQISDYYVFIYLCLKCKLKHIVRITEPCGTPFMLSDSKETFKTSEICKFNTAHKILRYFFLNLKTKTILMNYIHLHFLYYNTFVLVISNSLILQLVAPSTSN